MHRFIYILIVFLFASCTVQQRTKKALSKNKNLISDMAYFDGMKAYYKNADASAISLFNKSIDLNKSNDAAYFMLSKIYQTKRDAVNALKNAKLAYLYDSSNKEYGINYAMLLTRQKLLDSALSVYSSLIEKDPKDVDMLLNVSLLYGMKGDLEKSIKFYDDYSSKYSNSELVLANKQKLYIQMNRLDSAIAVGNRLIELYPDDPSYPVIVGDIYSSMGNDSLSIVYNRKALEIVPSYPLAQIGLSDAYRRSGLYQNYFGVLNDIFRNDEIHNGDKVNYFKQFFDNKSFYQLFYPNIDTLIRNFISTYPKDTSIYAIYTDHLTKMGSLDELNVFLRDKIDNGSKDSLLHARFIELNFYLKKYDTTSIYSSRAIELFPQKVNFFLYKAFSLFQTKQYDSTITVLKHALNLEVKDSMRVELLSMIGDSYHSLGKVDDSFKYYDEALKINPKNIQVLNNYSYYLSLIDKNLSKALKMINVVLEQEPNNGTYLDTKAWILYKLGRYAEAKQVMRQALIYGGNENDTILEHYGDILEKLNDKETAAMYWQMSYNKGNRSKELLKKLNIE